MGGMNQDLTYAIRKARQRANESLDGIAASIADPLINGMANAAGVTTAGIHKVIATGITTSLFDGQLKIGPGSIFMYTIEGIGSSADKTEVVAFEYRGQVKNIAGTTTLVDTPFKLMETKDGDVNLTIVADDDTDTLKVNFTNNSGKTYNVSTFVKLIKVI